MPHPVPEQISQSTCTKPRFSLLIVLWLEVYIYVFWVTKKTHNRDIADAKQESNKLLNSIDPSPQEAKLLDKPLVFKTKSNAMEEMNHLTVAIMPLDSVGKVGVENLQGALCSYIGKCFFEAVQNRLVCQAPTKMK